MTRMFLNAHHSGNQYKIHIKAGHCKKKILMSQRGARSRESLETTDLSCQRGKGCSSYSLGYVYSHIKGMGKYAYLQEYVFVGEDWVLSDPN